MALSVATVFEVRQNGNDTNSGGWVTGATGVDYSQQTSPQYAVVDGVTAGTTTITSATAAFGTDVVGNLIYVQGGTGTVTANWYQITSRTNATTIVVDRATGLTAGTGVTLNIGGALGTPGQAALLMTLAGMMCWVKYSATPYTLTTATPGSGGPIVLAANQALFFSGYDVTRGDRTGNRPIVSWGAVAAPGSNAYIFTAGTAARQIFANLLADGNSVVNVSGFLGPTSARTVHQNCIAQNCNQSGSSGITSGANNTVIRCALLSCTTGVSGLAIVEKSYATLCTVGFSNYTAISRCIASICGTGYSTTTTGTLTQHCVADACTSIGFDMTATNSGLLESCVASNQSGVSAIGVKTSSQAVIINVAFYNNASDLSGTAPLWNFGSLAIGADPYVNQAGGDFRPNANSPGGGQIRNAAIHIYGQSDNLDIGADQHADTTVGGQIQSRVFTGF